MHSFDRALRQVSYLQKFKEKNKYFDTISFEIFWQHSIVLKFNQQLTAWVTTTFLNLEKNINQINEYLKMTSEKITILSNKNE